MSDTARIDKWLHAMRIFKTRTLAADACKSGKVKIADDPVKASRTVRAGDVITVRDGAFIRTVKVLMVTEKRLGAKLVPEYMEDLTPASEYEKLAAVRINTPYFEGKGRPTKKDRRRYDEFTGEE